MCVLTATAGPSGYDAFLEWMSTDDNPIADDLYDVPPAVRASVRSLVVETKVGKSADDLLEVYEGREEELVKQLSKHLVKMKSEKEVNAARAVATVEEIKTLCDETNVSADDLLETYSGREEQLLKYLRKLKAKQDMDAATLAKIETLVDELELGESRQKMLDAYDGKEEVLLKNLRKMKAKNAENAATVAEIKSLVVETNCGKSSEELLEKYAGNEKALLKNLRKLSSSTTVATSGTASVTSLDASQHSRGAPTKAKSYQQLIAEKKAAKKHTEKPDGGGAKSYQQLIAEKKAAKKLAGQ